MNTSKKNSVTAFKKKPSPILEAASVTTPDVAVEATQQAPKRKQGRPLKGAVKRSHKVMLAFTPAEGEASRDKAGDIPEATFVYKFLKENGYFD